MTFTEKVVNILNKNINKFITIDELINQSNVNNVFIRDLCNRLSKISKAVTLGDGVVMLEKSGRMVSGARVIMDEKHKSGVVSKRLNFIKDNPEFMGKLSTIELILYHQEMGSQSLNAKVIASIAGTSEKAVLNLFSNLDKCGYGVLVDNNLDLKLRIQLHKSITDISKDASDIIEVEPLTRSRRVFNISSDNGVDLNAKALYRATRMVEDYDYRNHEEKERFVHALYSAMTWSPTV